MELKEKYQEYGGHFIVAGSIISIAVCWYTTRRAKSCARSSKEDEPLKNGNEITKQGFSMKKVPADLDVIIIGSGMGGLATAALLAREGKKVLVLEQHDTAGGNTHTFVENGYEFDTGLHYVGFATMKLLENITESIKWERMDDEYDMAIVQKADGSSDRVLIHRNWNVLIPKLKQMFPTEHDAIDKFFQLVEQIMRWIPLFFVLKRVPTWMKSLIEPIFASKLRWFTYTTSDVIDSLTTNVKLKGILTYFWGNYGEVPERSGFFCHCLCWDHFSGGGGYYPIGGSAAIPEKIIPVIESYGGRVLVRAPVSEILINETNNTAYGVKVKDKIIYAHAIVSSVGAPATYTKLISPVHQSLVKEQIEFMKKPKVEPLVSMMSLFVGFEGDAEELKIKKKNFWIFPSWDHNENWKRYTNDKDYNTLVGAFVSFSSAKDPLYSKRLSKNKHVALIISPCVFDSVEEYSSKRVKHRGGEYEAKKEMWTRIMLDMFLREFPHLKDKITYQELGTAVTNDFYLGTLRGAIYGLSHTPERFNETTGITPETPFRNLFLTGQDTTFLGIMGAVFSGYLTASILSKKAMLRMAAKGVTINNKHPKYF